MKKIVACLTSLALTLGVVCAMFVGFAVASATVTTFEDLYVGEYETDTHSGLAHIVFGTVSDTSAEYGIVVEDETGAKFLFQGKAIGEDGKFGIALYEVPDGDYVAYAYTGSGDARVLGNGVAFTVGSVYEREGDVVTMGEQPGKVVTDAALINALSKLNADANGKIVYEGKAYASFVAQPYNDYFFANGNKVMSGETYFFELEAMKWLVIDETDSQLTLISKDVLKAVQFNDVADDVNYADATVKSEVEKFVASCLTDEQEDIAVSVAIPSADDVNKLSERSAKLTDYAKASGAYVEDLTDYAGNGAYWIDGSAGAYVDANGLVMNQSADLVPVNVTYIGIRPMVVITK